MSLARAAGEDVGRMAGLLAYLLPADARHQEKARAGLVLVAEGLVCLRDVATLARGLLKAWK